MRFVIYDIQNPTDPQVNGFGLYRTVVNGTTPLLIDKPFIPTVDNGVPCISHTHPWEAADVTDFAGIGTDSYLSLNFTVASQFTFNIDGVSTPTFCTSTQVWEVEPYNHLNSEDTNGYRGSYLWEMAGQFRVPEGTPITETRFTWAFCTIQPDDDLGAEVEVDNNIPPLGYIAALYNEQVFISGIPHFPHYVAYSKRFNPESFPLDNITAIGSPADPVTQLTPIAGLLGVFTVKTKYRLTGNTDSGFTHAEALSRRGTRAWKTCLPTDHGIIFVANDGVFTTNLVGADTKISADIEPLFIKDTTLVESPINMDQATKFAAAYYKTKYRFAYVAGLSNTEINRELIYDFDSERWAINDLNMASYFVEEETDFLTAGGQDGILYRLENSDQDLSINIPYQWASKKFSGNPGDTQAVRNLFLYYRVDAEIPYGESMTVEFWVDDVLMKTDIITGTRTNELHSLPEDTCGFKWQIKVHGGSRLGGHKVYGFTAWSLPLGALQG